MAVIAPIHVEAVGLGNVRFFAPPSGGREFPWVSLDDLMVCMNVPQEMRRMFKSDMRRGPFADSTKMVAVADGIANIVPHFVAQGVIGVNEEIGRAPKELYWHYAKASAAALDKLTDGFSQGQIFAYLRDALAAGGGVSAEPRP